MKTVMAHKFSQTAKAEIQRSSFDRSHGLKTTFDAGLLIPIFFDEALPGDTINLSMTALARLATPIKPIMDNMFMETFFFDIPMRLLWDNWAKFNGAQDDPGDSTDFLLPQILGGGGGFLAGGLEDYFGIPLAKANVDISAMWHRAYVLCYNEWFRDENLQVSFPLSRGNGPDSADDYQLLRRGKRHDYFTSCLPWPQKSDFGAVTLPLGDKAPVKGLGNITQSFSQTDEEVYESGATGSRTYDFSTHSEASVDLLYLEGTAATGGFPTLFADLSEATSATINQLRQAFQIQRMFERDARGGTRLVEIILAHFNVVSPDARQQRPEYLGGGSTPVNINPVSQTSDQISGGGGAETPQGNLAAFGTASLRGHGFVKSFTEHSIVLGLVCVRADLTYQSGLQKMWSRQTRFDFFWPALAHLGEVAVLNREIHTEGDATDDIIFGYQEKDADYRFKQSTITGLFRSNVAGSLDVWHLSQDFLDTPVLGPTFIEENPPIDRVIAVQDEPHFIFDSFFRQIHVRPIPTYGTPGLIDHF